MSVIVIDEVKKTTTKELSKSQNVRLLDVFFIAPFLFYVGGKAKGLSQTERYILYGIALGTLVYNGRNYLINKKK